ncbi:MAG: FAD-dependent oxidoreductase [Clostridiaceae bacterium]|nr:FAD-dependent oxidoreductase [Clostridiaceae bacterium]
MKYDVIVAGGGTAGVSAAVAAARGGAKTLLIEQYGHLGGTAVSGIPFLGSMDCNGEIVNRGIFSEIIQRMTELKACFGYATGAYWNTPDTPGKYKFSLVPFDPEYYKYVAQELVLEAGAEILFHTYISDVIMDGNRICAIEAVNKSGKQPIEAGIFIDCTGDADLIKLAGGSFMDNLHKQNCSILFRIGGVDLDQLILDIKDGTVVRGWENWHMRLTKSEKEAGVRPTLVHIAGHMILGNDEPEITFTAVSLRDGEIFLNATRVAGLSGVDAKEITKAEVEERRNVIRVFGKMKEMIPAFRNSRLLTTSPIGFRETRNIVGEYIMTMQDVIDGAQFTDGVARGGYPIDIHDPKGGRTQFYFIQNGGSYEIPYRSMVPKEIEGVLVAGKTISAEHEAAGSVRIMGCVIAQGEAVGTAAALAAVKGIMPRQVDTDRLRKVLIANGAIV